MLVTFFYKLKGKDMSTKQRAHVTLKDFLRVTIAERDTIDNVTDAASELGMTPASFKQRLLTEKKRYPKLYENTESYTADSRRIPSEEEASSILAELLS
jgi:phage terminase small subunit